MLGNKKIDELLNQPMNRRQFLRNVGFLILSVIGISNALHILSGRHSNNPSSGGGNGYNQGKFGG